METECVVTPGGVRLVYAVEGPAAAPPMVLLHALGDRGSDWDPVVARFAEDFRVLTLDLRGHGDSDWPGVYSFALMAEDVLGFLDECGLDKVTLVGHSMGGMVAYLVAIQQPGRVERLVVEDAPPPYRRDRPPPDRPDGTLTFDWALVPSIVGAVNAGDPATWEALRVITAPTLLVGGSSSHIPQEKLAAVAELIPQCELVTLEAGHNVHAVRPTEFADLVLSWLRGSTP